MVAHFALGARHWTKKQACRLPSHLRSALAYGNLLDMSKRTRAHQLIEERLGRPLDRYVLTARGRETRAKASWSRISADLLAETGVHVTPETLRMWFYDLERRRLDRARTQTAA